MNAIWYVKFDLVYNPPRVIGAWSPDTNGELPLHPATIPTYVQDFLRLEVIEDEPGQYIAWKFNDTAVLLGAEIGHAEVETTRLVPGGNVILTCVLPVPDRSDNARLCPVNPVSAYDVIGSTPDDHRIYGHVYFEVKAPFGKAEGWYYSVLIDAPFFKGEVIQDNGPYGNLNETLNRAADYAIATLRFWNLGDIGLNERARKALGWSVMRSDSPKKYKYPG